MGAPSPDDRLATAAARATRLHAGQRRKGTELPYVSHLFAVAALVLEHGGDTDQAIAGLLHDVLEDTELSAAELGAEFGPEVRRLVEGCTDTLKGDTPETKSAWAARKVPYLRRLKTADDRTLLVAACDKRHNLGALVVDLRRHGPGYLDRFNAGPAEQLWYHEQLADVFRGRVPEPLDGELDLLLKELRELLPGVTPAAP